MIRFILKVIFYDHVNLDLHSFSALSMGSKGHVNITQSEEIYLTYVQMNIQLILDAPSSVLSMRTTLAQHFGYQNSIYRNRFY